MGIDTKGVIVGGLVAGVVINALEFASNFLLGDRFSGELEALGLSAEFGTGQMVFGLVFSFVLGIACVWTYAAIRPRFGAGVKTSVIAGLLVWFFAVLMVVVSFASLGMFTTGLLAIVAVWELVEIPLATTAGAYFYKEGHAG